MSDGTIIGFAIMLEIWLMAFWIVALDIRTWLREIRDDLREWNRRANDV